MQTATVAALLCRQVHVLHVTLVLQILVQQLSNGFHPGFEPDHPILDSSHLVK